MLLWIGFVIVVGLLFWSVYPSIFQLPNKRKWNQAVEDHNWPLCDDYHRQASEANNKSLSRLKYAMAAMILFMLLCLISIQ